MFKVQKKTARNEKAEECDENFGVLFRATKLQDIPAAVQVEEAADDVCLMPESGGLNDFSGTENIFNVVNDDASNWMDFTWHADFDQLKLVRGLF